MANSDLSGYNKISLTMAAVMTKVIEQHEILLPKIKMEASDQAKTGRIRKAIRVGKSKKQIKMSKYLIKASYNANGIKGLIEEGGTQRKITVEKMLTELGGEMEAFYYAFGEHDVYAIFDLPDHVSAAAAGLRINSSGLVTVSTTVLLSPEEIDKASKTSVSYRAPGAK